MKRLLFIISIFIVQSMNSQTTLIPDPIFEQELINLGLDTGIPNGSVPTSNIDTLTYLDVGMKNINDLTGIEDFVALQFLYCNDNFLTSLDVSQNTSLWFLWCYANQLTNLDVSQNTSLFNLMCSYNYITELNVSQNTSLQSLYCEVNNLSCLNVRNGNNSSMTLNATSNSNLYCIEVDNVSQANTNWASSIDAQASFSTNCGNSCTVGINDYFIEQVKIYPNPTSGIINVESDLYLSYAIFNMLGEELQSGYISANKEIRINQPSGIYFLKLIDTKEQTTTIKMIKE